MTIHRFCRLCRHCLEPMDRDVCSRPYCRSVERISAAFGAVFGGGLTDASEAVRLGASCEPVFRGAGPGDRPTLGGFHFVPKPPPKNILLNGLPERPPMPDVYAELEFGQGPGKPAEDELAWGVWLPKCGKGDWAMGPRGFGRPMTRREAEDLLRRLHPRPECEDALVVRREAWQTDAPPRPPVDMAPVACAFDVVGRGIAGAIEDSRRRGFRPGDTVMDMSLPAWGYGTVVLVMGDEVVEFRTPEGVHRCQRAALLVLVRPAQHRDAARGAFRLGDVARVGAGFEHAGFGGRVAWCEGDAVVLQMFAVGTTVTTDVRLTFPAWHLELVEARP